MSKNELSNLSYTNKDFNSIYAELLEYAKKLSYKWDPTASDESDPGVVLLKLAALIGDKDNYNIDKNVLELMPASVTQLPSARQLFDQCGYAMRYYRAAQGDVNLTIKKDLGEDLTEETKEEFKYTIPQFTMFTDSDSTIVYTSTKPVTVSVKTEVPIPVMEGTITHYTVNNDALITMQNLDSNNRLYFTETNIAENGIFITNVDKANYEDWVRVDNLQTQPKGSYCYKFGVTIDNSICYIEFPEDIELLIDEGLNISYILTSGATGNISLNKLREFYVDTKFTRSNLLGTESLDVDATTENITIRNTLPILNGEDPESIDDAYKNYKRVRDTFNTLVSLKDYTDYLITSGTASNGYVCDRTNDIQHSYKIVTTVGNSTYLKTIVDSETYYKGSSRDNVDEVTEHCLDAFDLCVYALEYVPVVTSDTELKKSFQIFDLASKYELDKSIFKEQDGVDVKSLQHDFVKFKTDKILMLKNKYPVTANIIPKYPLSVTEKIQVMYNVETALCKALNSNQMTFGDAASIDVIQEAILNADERVKTLIDFSSPKYETYAVYKTEKEGKPGEFEFKELRIDNESLDGGYVETSMTRSKFDALSSPLFIYDSVQAKFINVKNPKDATLTTTYSYDSSETYYTYDAKLSKLWNDFRVEIFAKNVLAGVTPLYNDDNTYTIGVNQTKLTEFNPVTKISTNTVIELKDQGNGSWKSEPLRGNESILLTAPNFIQENNFSSYVKVLYFFNETDKIVAGTNHELRDDEFIMFFWKDSDTSQHYSYIKYDGTDKSPARFVSPSGFNLPAEQDLTSQSFTKTNSKIHYGDIKAYFKGFPPGKGTTNALASSKVLVEKNDESVKIYGATEFIENCLKSDSKSQVLTGTKIINMMNVNTIQINNQTNGCRYVSWILNQKTTSGTYVLFDENTTYTLKSGEYFLYMNDEKTMLHLLGEGTRIERSADWLATPNRKWSVKAVDYDTLITEGIDSVNWYTLSLNDNNYKLWATEQQQILIGPENSLVLTSESSKFLWPAGVSTIPKDNPPSPLEVSFSANNQDFTGIDIAIDREDSNKKSIVFKYTVKTETGKNEDRYEPVSTVQTETSDCTIYPEYRNIIVKKDHYELMKAYFEKLDNTVFSRTLIYGSNSVNLKGFSIAYVDNAANMTTVTPIDAKSIGWSATSILNLNMSPDSAQRLQENQSITIYEGTEGTEVSGVGTGAKYIPKYVQCSEDLNIVGGTNIDIESMFTSAVGMIAYEPAEQEHEETEETPLKYYSSTNSVVIHVKPNQLENGGNQKLYPVSNLLAGNYLLEVTTSKPVEGLEVVCSVPSIFERIRKTNTYRLNVSDRNEFRLTVSWTKADIDTIITIYPLFKYTTKTLDKIKVSSETSGETSAETSFEQQLLGKIGDLDKDSLFMYTYRPSTPIKNPLIAEEFLKNNHFYNKYTICEWNADVENNVTVHDVVR